MSLCDQSAEGSLNTTSNLWKQRQRLCFIPEQVSSSEVQPFQLCASVSGRTSPEIREIRPSVGGCLVVK